MYTHREKEPQENSEKVAIGKPRREKLTLWASWSWTFSLQRCEK